MWLFALLACGSEEESCAPGGDPGLSTSVGDATFLGDDAAWRFAGAAVQVNASGGDGSSISMVLQTTTDGTALDAAVAPFSVDLGEGGGGWLVYYPPDGASAASNVPGGAGSLQVASFDGTLTACFSGTLGGDAGDLAFTGELVAPEAAAP